MLDVTNYFPRRVWFQTRSGYASREATKADWAVREQLFYNLTRSYRDDDEAECATIPDPSE